MLHLSRRFAIFACAFACANAAHATTIDPNTANSPFSGVVSINIQYSGKSFICSGALVGARSVVTSGSCVDTNGNGAAVDLNQPGSLVTVIFNSDGANNAQVTASAITLHPNFQGFNVCPAAASPGNNCLGDDLAVLTLAADAPASATIYSVATNPVTSGASIVIAGYGNPGDGVTAEGGASYTDKRTGANQADVFDGNDEADFGGANEVFYADFDGNGVDSFCSRIGVCTGQLAPGLESTIASGDIGGPVFVMQNGQLVLAGINTFTGGYGEPAGTFGSYFGGVLLASYGDFLLAATDGTVTLLPATPAGVPEPGSVALLGLGMLLLVGARRRTRGF